VLQKTEKQVIASAGVVDFIEITDSNIQSFHFHGDTAEFPLTSIIAIADSEKNETLLEGRYETGRANLQFTRPPKVIRELMAMVFQVNRFFEANSFLVAVATAMLLGLVVVLSLRLRMREMETMFRLGSSRSTIAWLQIWELAIILFFAAVILAGLIGWIWSISDGVVQALLTQG
jgi:putative ABC transport system permease protein